jgi:hypothetical protein
MPKFRLDLGYLVVGSGSDYFRLPITHYPLPIKHQLQPVQRLARCKLK